MRLRNSSIASTLSAKPAPLPAPLLESDAARPKYTAADKLAYDEYGQSLSFQMYYIARFGWCICTLLIRKGSLRSSTASTARFYGIAVEDRQLVRIGRGPHVLREVTIYVREKRKAALKSILDIKSEGEVRANECRDTRSSRIAQTHLRRFGIGSLGYF